MASSLLIAAAGGVGAAIGASLAQFVQWWREHVRTDLEERRRSEDVQEIKARDLRTLNAQQEAETRVFQRELAVKMVGVLREIERAALELDRDMQDTVLGPKAWRAFVATSIPRLDQLVILGSSHGGEGLDELVPVWRFFRIFLDRSDLEDGCTRRLGTHFLRVSNTGLWFTKHRYAFPVGTTTRLFYGALFELWGVLEYSIELSRVSLGATGTRPRLRLGAEHFPPRREVSIASAEVNYDDDGDDAEARDLRQWADLTSVSDEDLWADNEK